MANVSHIQIAKLLSACVNCRLGQWCLSRFNFSLSWTNSVVFTHHFGFRGWYDQKESREQRHPTRRDHCERQQHQHQDHNNPQQTRKRLHVGLQVQDTGFWFGWWWIRGKSPCNCYQSPVITRKGRRYNNHAMSFWLRAWISSWGHIVCFQAEASFADGTLTIHAVPVSTSLKETTITRELSGEQMIMVKQQQFLHSCAQLKQTPLNREVMKSSPKLLFLQLCPVQKCCNKVGRLRLSYQRGLTELGLNGLGWFLPVQHCQMASLMRHSPPGVMAFLPAKIRKLFSPATWSTKW